VGFRVSVVQLVVGVLYDYGMYANTQRIEKSGMRAYDVTAGHVGLHHRAHRSSAPSSGVTTSEAP